MPMHDGVQAHRRLVNGPRHRVPGISSPRRWRSASPTGPSPADARLAVVRIARRRRRQRVDGAVEQQLGRIQGAVAEIPPRRGDDARRPRAAARNGTTTSARTPRSDRARRRAAAARPGPRRWPARLAPAGRRNRQRRVCPPFPAPARTRRWVPIVLMLSKRAVAPPTRRMSRAYSGHAPRVVAALMAIEETHANRADPVVASRWRRRCCPGAKNGATTTLPTSPSTTLTLTRAWTLPDLPMTKNLACRPAMHLDGGDARHVRDRRCPGQGRPLALEALDAGVVEDREADALSRDAARGRWSARSERCRFHAGLIWMLAGSAVSIHGRLGSVPGSPPAHPATAPASASTSVRATRPVEKR